MIYNYPKSEEPIRQGDIFFYLPAVQNIDLDTLRVITSEGQVSDIDIKDFQEDITLDIKISAEAATGIVLTQDCDTERNSIITFLRIFPLSVQNPNPPKDPKKYFKFILDTPNSECKWYYLPADEKMGFKTAMMVSFESTFQVTRNSLENHKELRKARLNEEQALPHFRRLISDYFTRYAYDKWYPLTKEELVEYNKLQDDDEKVEPFPNQK